MVLRKNIIKLIFISPTTHKLYSDLLASNYVTISLSGAKLSSGRYYFSSFVQRSEFQESNQETKSMAYFAS